MFRSFKSFKKSLSLKFYFKLGDFLKFSDFNEAPTNSLMMIY